MVGALTSVLMRAQARDQPIVSGEDVGFRIEGRTPAGDPLGTWMIRVNGKWVPATAKTGVRPATQ
jgi:hypothetical protein